MEFFILIRKHEKRQARLFFFQTCCQDRQSLCNVNVIRDLIIISKAESRGGVVTCEVCCKDRPLVLSSNFKLKAQMLYTYSCIAFHFHIACKLTEVSCLGDVHIACNECAVTDFFLCTFIGFGDGSVVSEFQTCTKCHHHHHHHHRFIFQCSGLPAD